jgi:hypothetical protein
LYTYVGFAPVALAGFIGRGCDSGGGGGLLGGGTIRGVVVARKIKKEDD